MRMVYIYSGQKSLGDHRNLLCGQVTTRLPQIFARSSSRSIVDSLYVKSLHFSVVLLVSYVTLLEMFSFDGQSNFNF